MALWFRASGRGGGGDGVVVASTVHIRMKFVDVALLFETFWKAFMVRAQCDRRSAIA
jgi:hypothetical protein